MLGNKPSVHETDDDLPEVEVAKRHGFSIVWLIPLVAGAIAIWLGYTTLRDRGPTITITLPSATGLEAGKTTVKYKDVNVGLVEEVRLSGDLSQIIVTARMAKEIEPYMNEGTRFWVVRPRIGAGGVSGLDTLLSGAYVELDPGQGDRTDTFIGLEEPPPISSDAPGRQYLLRAKSLGSIARGSPVYYRDVEVGQVLGYQLADDRQSLEIQVFVNAPQDELVRSDSRFWNASGVDVSLGAEGVNVAVESVQALLAGGVAFDTPSISRPGAAADAGTAFPLYDSFASVSEAIYTQETAYLVHFDGSVRGLRAGAPVEFRGMKVGTVSDVRLEIDAATEAIKIPVTLALQPERITVLGAKPDLGPHEFMERLVDRGLRAQLQSGNLLTGELLVELDFHPDSPPAKLGLNGTYPEIPSVPTEIEALTASLTGILDKVAALPLDGLIQDVRRTLESVETLTSSSNMTEALAAVSRTAASLESLVAKVDQQMGPLLQDARSALASTDSMVGPNSQLRYDLQTLLRELSNAARSIRVFADYLERHPEALLRGKSGFGTQ
jgi:paraquat-inducible protein B